MTPSRPMSDRHHEPATPTNRYEVRVPVDSDAPRWRTVACAAEYDDAAAVATALIGDGTPFSYTEVWGSGAGDRDDHRRVLARFPKPDRDEQQRMWREAADTHFASGYSDLDH